MRGMNRILVNRFLVSLVFVSCGLLWVSVEGAVCNPSRSCIDVGELGADCTEHNSYWCICAPGYANHSETGACIDVCDELKCTSSDANEGTCTALKGCDCKAGHANLTDGTCVPGSVCTGNKEECHGVCMEDNPAWCKCGKGSTNSATGECVLTCAAVQCVESASNTTGCANETGCECKKGYTNTAAGTCVADCTSCKRDPATDGTCSTDASGDVACGCKAGHVLSSTTGLCDAVSTSSTVASTSLATV
eukprot:Lankesteria_metandrocarpae@DN5148_c0_g1_i10.p1